MSEVLTFWSATKSALIKKRKLQISSRGRLKIFAVIVLLWSFLACWAVSSPVGSAADDNYHLASIWCSSTSNGLCEESGESFSVPKLIAGNSYKCFIQYGEVDKSKYNKSAECINNGTDVPETINYLNNNQKMYPNFFYDVSGFFAGDSVTKSVISIRLFWGTLFCGLVLSILLIGKKESIFPFTFSILLFLAPVSGFLLVSTNPTAGCIISLFALPYFLKYFQTNEGIGKGISAAIILSLVFLSAGSRTDGGFFAVLLILFWAVINHKSVSIKSRLSILAPASFIMLGTIIAVLAQSKSVGLQAVASQPTSALLDFSRLGSNFINLYKYYVGIWGLDWSLGWRYEPELPGYLSYVQACLLILVLWKFLRIRALNERIAITFIVLSLLLVPLYLFQISGSDVGEMVQPRYLLPFVIGIFNMAMIELKKPLKRFPSSMFFVSSSIFLWVGLVSFNAQLTRVTRGANGNIFDEPKSTDWWWSGAFISPGVLLILYILISFALTVLLSSLLRENLKKENDTVGINS